MLSPEGIGRIARNFKSACEIVMKESDSVFIGFFTFSLLVLLISGYLCRIPLTMLIDTNRVLIMGVLFVYWYVAIIVGGMMWETMCRSYRWMLIISSLVIAGVLLAFVWRDITSPMSFIWEKWQLCVTFCLFVSLCLLFVPGIISLRLMKSCRDALLSHSFVSSCCAIASLFLALCVVNSFADFVKVCSRMTSDARWLGFFLSWLVFNACFLLVLRWRSKGGNGAYNMAVMRFWKHIVCLLSALFAGALYYMHWCLVFDKGQECELSLILFVVAFCYTLLRYMMRSESLEGPVSRHLLFWKYLFGACALVGVWTSYLTPLCTPVQKSPLREELAQQQTDRRSPKAPYMLHRIKVIVSKLDRLSL